MSTYFGHKAKNRVRNFGVPKGGPPALRPPTPVQPRGGGSLGGGYNKYVLPGPGPRAGGRYNIYGPGSPTGFKTPRTGPAGRLGPVVDSGFARNAMAYGRYARMLARFGPVGRAFDLAGMAMDLWATTQEGVPGGDFYPYDMSGFTRLCRDLPPPYGHIKWSSNDPNLPCGTPSQVPNTFNGSGVAIPTGMRWVSYGKTNPGATRMPLSEQWYRPDALTSPRPYVAPPGVQWPLPVPAVVQPIPGTATPPKPQGETKGYPRNRPRYAEAPKPYVDIDPEVKPGSKPTPDKPPVHTRLPAVGEEKWVIHDGLIGQLYGWLTELKDGLECFEANMEGYVRKTPNIIQYGKAKPSKERQLHHRAIRAAMWVYEHPNQVDWEGFGKCIQEEGLKDRVIGTANKLANRITKSPYWVRPVGVGRGAFAQRF